VIAGSHKLRVFLHLMHVTRMKVHLLETLIVVVVNHALTVVGLVRVLVPSIVLECHQGLTVHFVLPAIV